MKNLNHFNVSGRLGDNATRTDFPGNNGGGVVFNFIVMNNYNVKEGKGFVEKTNLIPVSYFTTAAMANSLQQRLIKGAYAIVDGEIRQAEWTDRTTGEIKKGWNFKANTVEAIVDNGVLQANANRQINNQNNVRYSNNMQQAPTQYSNNMQQAPVQYPNNMQQTPVQYPNNVQQTPVQYPNNMQQAPVQYPNNMQQAPVQYPNNMQQTPVQYPNNVQQAPTQCIGVPNTNPNGVPF